MAKRRKIYRTIETDIFGNTVRDKVDSKAKGDNNERVASRFIGGWTGEKFSRVPRSGGLHWKNASNMCGDIACENEDFNFLFTIETKHYADFADPILDGRELPNRNKLTTFWKQAVSDADRAGKLPMVLARKNGMEAGTYYVVIDIRLFCGYTVYADSVNFPHATGKCESRNYAVFHSRDLIAQFPYENFATYINNHYLCGDN